MNQIFPFSQFITLFPDDESCLTEIKRLRFPEGTKCEVCHKITNYHKVTGRTAFSCTHCRTHVYPLSGTIFEKTTTPLRLWFYAGFLMTQTKADISAKQLQRELGVTYKTAWRMRSSFLSLMEQNNADLLSGPIEFDETFNKALHKAPEESKVYRWSFFNKIEFKVVQRKESS